jgi:hypothetical protein
VGDEPQAQTHRERRKVAWEVTVLLSLQRLPECHGTAGDVGAGAPALGESHSVAGTNWEARLTVGNPLDHHLMICPHPRLIRPDTLSGTCYDLIQPACKAALQTQMNPPRPRLPRSLLSRENGEPHELDLEEVERT